MIISNLSYEIRRSWVRPRGMMVGLILIHKGHLLGMKMKIYHQIMRVIIKGRCNHKPTNITNKDWFLYLALGIRGRLYIIASEIVAVEDILMIYADGNVWQCHPIIGGISVDNKKQVVITGIKSGMQCSICHVPPEKREIFYKIWLKQTHESICTQLT